MSDIITTERLAEDFRKLGVKEGKSLVVHSSLKNIGWTKNGADTVIDALLSVLGKAGTLMVPTFTYSYLNNSEVEAFDRKTSQCFTGIIPETLRKREGALRSEHPSHSFAAIGKNAAYLLEGQPLDAALGKESPLHRLTLVDGMVMLLGVGQDKNTILHTAEALSDIGYTKVPYKESMGRAVKRINGEGMFEILPQVDFPGCSFNFGVMEGVFKLKGLIKYGRAGNAVVQLMNAKDIVEEAIRVMQKQPDFMLCYRHDCESCTNRRKYLEDRA